MKAIIDGDREFGAITAMTVTVDDHDMDSNLLTISKIIYNCNYSCLVVDIRYVFRGWY